MGFLIPSSVFAKLVANDARTDVLIDVRKTTCLCSSQTKRSERNASCAKESQGDTVSQGGVE